MQSALSSKDAGRLTEILECLRDRLEVSGLAQQVGGSGRFSPAVTARRSRFSGGGNAQTEKAVNTHGGCTRG